MLFIVASLSGVQHQSVAALQPTFDMSETGLIVVNNNSSRKYPVCCGLEWRPVMYFRLFMACVFISIIVITIVEYATIFEWIEEYLDWVEYNHDNSRTWLSVLTFWGVELIAVPLFVTSMLFNVAGGYIFA